jgi:hypothetical protein
MPDEKYDISKMHSKDMENKFNELIDALDKFAPHKKPGLAKTHPANLNLERLLNDLAIVLGEHAKALERHVDAMENLTQAVKQLETTIKKEISLASKQPSMELKEAITSFLEDNVNLKYYRDSDYLKLPAGTDTKHPEIVKKTKHQKPQPIDSNENLKTT